MAAGQVLITSGPFRHNARATVTVEPEALGMARIVITCPGQNGGAPFRVETVHAGEHLEALYEQIGRVVKAARRQARKEAAEASGLRAA